MENEFNTELLSAEQVTTVRSRDQGELRYSYSAVS